MIVAIVGVFLLADRFLAGMLSGYLFWIMPLPTLLYSAKYGWKSSIIVLISITIVAFITNGDLYTVVLSFVTSMTGLVYGDGVKMKRSNTWLLTSSILTTFVNYALTSVLLPRMYGIDIYSDYRALIDEMAKYMNGIDVNRLYSLVPQLAFASIILAAVMEAVIVHIIAHVILKRMRFDVQPLRQMETFRIPKWAGWLMLGSIVLSVANSRYQFVPALSDFLNFLGVSSEMVFVIMGYLLVIMMGKAMNRRFIGLLAMVFVFFAPMMLMVMGILDVVTDYRERVMVRYQNGQKQ